MKKFKIKYSQKGFIILFHLNKFKIQIKSYKNMKTCKSKYSK